MNTLLFLNLGGGEVMIVVLVIILFFGSKGVPDIARGLGRGLREFKDATNGIQRDIQDSINTLEKEEKETGEVKKEIKHEGVENTIPRKLDQLD